MHTFYFPLEKFRLRYARERGIEGLFGYRASRDLVVWRPVLNLLESHFFALLVVLPCIHSPTHGAFLWARFPSRLTRPTPN